MNSRVLIESFVISLLISGLYSLVKFMNKKEFENKTVVVGSLGFVTHMLIELYKGLL